MDNKLEGAKRYAKEQYGELVVDVEYLCDYNGVSYFNPVFCDSPVFGLGLPFYIRVSNGYYSSSTFEEFEHITELLETQKHNQG